MSTSVLIAIIVVIAVVVVLAVLVALRQQRTRRLRDRFGPEYDRAVERAGERRAAETELAEREDHRERLEIVELDPAARSRYMEAWQATQAKFVDDPNAATREADQLITSVMRDRGYPVDDFEQRSADISVDHPHVVENYRSAHTASLGNESGRASTDELRQAFVHYRSLFAELLETGRDGHRYDGEEPTTQERAAQERATDERDVPERDVPDEREPHEHERDWDEHEHAHSHEQGTRRGDVR